MSQYFILPQMVIVSMVRAYRGCSFDLPSVHCICRRFNTSCSPFILQVVPDQRVGDEFPCSGAPMS